MASPSQSTKQQQTTTTCKHQFSEKSNVILKHTETVTAATTTSPHSRRELEADSAEAKMPTQAQTERQLHPEGPQLVDLLIDSQLDWRQLISEANPRERLGQYLNETQIKRQEVIHELIQTERHHCLTLALMRQVYLAGLLKLNERRQRNNNNQDSPLSAQQVQHTSCNQTAGLVPTQQATGADLNHANQSSQSTGEPIDIERLFPALEELIQAHELFFAHLRLRLVDCCSRDKLQARLAHEELQPHSKPVPLVGIIGPLGDLLIDQFKLSDKPCRLSSSRRDEKTIKSTRRQGVASDAAASQNAPQQEAELQPQSRSKTTTTATATAAATKTTTNNSNGYKLLQAYAKFCGQHYESSRYFKQLMQHDKGFKQFIEQCNKQQAACRQRGIPECNLLVAQRLTKYPLLIEQLIKTSKDEPSDEEEKLKQALQECRSLLAELNSQLARKESFERLLDIYAQFSPKSYTIYNHKSAVKFTKHDLLQHKRLRQLLHSDDQVRIWSATRRKLFPVLCLILNDIVVFLRVDEHQPASSSVSSQQQIVSGSGGQPSNLTRHLMDQQQQACSVHTGGLATSSSASTSNNNLELSTATQQQQTSAQAAPSQLQQQQLVQAMRYYFANIDNKSSVISLSKLLVREKAVEDPEPRVYLISSSPKQPEMYELAFISRRHQSNFIERLKSAIEQHNKSKLSSVLADYHHHHHHQQQHTATISSCCSLTASSLGDEDELEGESESSSLSCTAATPTSTASSSKSTSASEVGEESAVEEQLEDEQEKTQSLYDDGPETLKPEVVETHLEEAGAPRSSSSSPTNCDSPTLDLTLSERARDSCDDLSASKLLCQGQFRAVARHQKKTANRRRRFQRPRQVSNQSSDSCQSGTTSGTSLTSGIGGDLGTGPPGSEAACEVGCDHQQEEEAESAQLQGGAVAQANEEDQDSGRGQDDSSSSSAASFHDSMTALPSQQHQKSLTAELQPEMANNSTSGSATTKQLRVNAVVAVSTCSAGAQLVNTQQVACLPPEQTNKNRQLLKQGAKQRKLSTVSTISNQKKLLQKLRSVGLLTTGNSHQHASTLESASSLASHIDNNNSTQLPASSSLCSNCCQSLLEAANEPLNHHLHLQQRRHQQQLRRRSLFIPEQKLEELRNLRIQLDKDKQEWQEKFDRMQEQLLNERRDLDLARERLKQDKQQIENEREQLYRKLDILKENGILLSPSHKVIITSPDRAMMSGGSNNNSGGSFQHYQQVNYASVSLAPPSYNNLVNYQPVGGGSASKQQVAAAPPKVPLHLSQQSGHNLAATQHSLPQQQQQPNQQQQPQAQQNQYRVPLNLIPGASFLVKRFGGGGSSASPVPHGVPNLQQLNGKLSQSSMSIHSHQHFHHQDRAVL